jgi:4a-hydroxytetrahydrobiopterin dehydratase
MTELAQKHCKPCEGGSQPLGEDAVKALLASCPEWETCDEGKAIQRHFRFADFHQTMAFTNAVAWIAHREDHHPDISLGYNHCTVKYSTHAVNGLSENDFICAANIDALLLPEAK